VHKRIPNFQKIAFYAPFWTFPLQLGCLYWQNQPSSLPTNWVWGDEATTVNNNYGKTFQFLPKKLAKFRQKVKK
jgi:hypothetical protein